MAAQADGLITQMDADEGDQIARGSLMIQLDDRLANSELDVTRKETEAAEEKAKDDSEIKYSNAASEVASKTIRSPNNCLPRVQKPKLNRERNA